MIQGSVAAALLIVALQSSACAASKADFDKAFADAVAVQAHAGTIKNQWTSTQDALDAAKKAADAGNYEQGEREAALAKAMATQSIAQAAEQKDAWRAAVIGADVPAATSSGNKMPR